MNLPNATADLWRYRRWLMAYYASVVLLVVILYFVKGRSWTANASFAPQARRGINTGFQGLAAQLGVTVPGGEATQSPLFYSDLLRSNMLLNDVVTAKYPAGDRRKAGHTLEQMLEIDGKTAQQRRTLTVRALRKRMVILTNAKTGVVDFSVRTPDPVTSAAVAQRLLELVNRFNLQTRQSNAAAERRFIQSRVNDVANSLRDAEDAEQSFLQRNRDYRNSPQLIFQHDRLDRAVQQQQQLYTALTQSLEQSKIEEVRDTPVITVIEQPEQPAFPDSLGIGVLGVILVALGTMFGLVAVVVRSRWMGTESTSWVSPQPPLNP